MITTTSVMMNIGIGLIIGFWLGYFYALTGGNDDGDE